MNKTNRDVIDDGRVLHTKINGIKQAIKTAEDELKEISDLGTVEVMYNLSYDLEGFARKHYRVNAPASCVTEQLNKDILDMKAELNRLMQDYISWAHDG